RAPARDRRRRLRSAVAAAPRHRTPPRVAARALRARRRVPPPRAPAPGACPTACCRGRARPRAASSAFSHYRLPMALPSSPPRSARPIVIAHRGACGYLPEHTFAAKAYAHAVGADFLEQDVVLSRDEVPVVFHDLVLDEVTDVAQLFAKRRRPDGHFYAIDF